MRIRMLLIPLVAAGALLAGCTSTGTGNPSSTPTPSTNGVEALPADQIVAKASDALKAAKSFHVTGPIKVSTFSLNLDMIFAGTDAKGTVSVLGVQLEALRAGGAVYLKAPSSLWTSIIPAANQSLIPQLEGKYVKVPDVLVASYLPTVDSLLALSGTVTKGDVVTIDGKQAITLKDADGAQMHVSLDGQPYPIDIVGVDGSKLTFTDIDASVTIDAPAAADTFDLTALMG